MAVFFVKWWCWSHFSWLPSSLCSLPFFVLTNLGRLPLYISKPASLPKSASQCCAGGISYSFVFHHNHTFLDAITGAGAKFLLNFIPDNFIWDWEKYFWTNLSLFVLRFTLYTVYNSTLSKKQHIEKVHNLEVFLHTPFVS